jgi:hypothetical protein
MTDDERARMIAGARRALDVFTPPQVLRLWKET